MTNENTPELNEQRLVALLRTINSEAPAPDEAMLQALRLHPANPISHG